MKIKDPTLANIAETWWKEQGHSCPKRNTKAWKKMYREWIEFAFNKKGE